VQRAGFGIDQRGSKRAVGQRIVRNRGASATGPVAPRRKRCGSRCHPATYLRLTRSSPGAAFRLQGTINQNTHELLREAQALLGHTIPRAS